ncbi:MAG TPA: hypothetical protein VGZ22_12620 [Isosphaeraceae bacterium]|jgi:hypothetical protein|nr:hypothetical protein [Isosphaeraceae bacterium]
MKFRSEHMAYPTLSAAAGMVGVAPSTLSRIRDLAVVEIGSHEKRVPPGELLRLGEHYKKVSLNGTAAELLEYARREAPEHEGAIERQIETYFAARSQPAAPMSVADFIALAKAKLPSPLADSIAAAVAGLTHDAGQPDRPASGREPMPGKLDRKPKGVDVTTRAAATRRSPGLGR